MTVKMFNCGQSAGKTFNNSLGYYLSGFADGEGSFNVSLIKRDEQKRHLEKDRERKYSQKQILNSY